MIINPNNGKPIFSAEELTLNEEQKKQHYAWVKSCAQDVLKKVKTADDLRREILKFFKDGLQAHRAEVLIDPREADKYFLASLEVYHVCLKYVFDTLEQQKKKQEKDKEKEKENANTETSTDTSTKKM